MRVASFGGGPPGCDGSVVRPVDLGQMVRISARGRVWHRALIPYGVDARQCGSVWADLGRRRHDSAGPNLGHRGVAAPARGTSWHRVLLLQHVSVREASAQTLFGSDLGPIWV
jgi:hypothetical protein